MLAYAEKRMLPELKVIWQEAFGDSEDYIDFFFSHKLTGTQTFDAQIVWLEKEKPVSMLTVLKAKIQTDGQGSELEFWYIYAVATKKEWQNRGIAAKMLEGVYQMAKSKNAVIGLVPASDKLFGYYGKLGFKNVFYRRMLSWKLEYTGFLKSEYKIAEIDAMAYKMLRDRQLSGVNYVNWDQDAVSYSFLENILLHGVQYKITYRGKDYILFGCKNESMFCIKETTIPEEILKQVVTEIGIACECTDAEVRLSVHDYQCGSISPFGMIKTEQKIDLQKKGYLGLALD